MDLDTLASCSILGRLISSWPCQNTLPVSASRNTIQFTWKALKICSAGFCGGSSPVILKFYGPDHINIQCLTLVFKKCLIQRCVCSVQTFSTILNRLIKINNKVLTSQPHIILLFLTADIRQVTRLPMQFSAILISF